MLRPQTDAQHKDKEEIKRQLYHTQGGNKAAEPDNGKGEGENQRSHPEGHQNERQVQTKTNKQEVITTYKRSTSSNKIMIKSSNKYKSKIAVRQIIRADNKYP